MNKIHRDGVDLSVAFEAAMKRDGRQESAASGPLSKLASEGKASGDDAGNLDMASSLRLRLRIALRRALRPIADLRKYSTRNLRSELRETRTLLTGMLNRLERIEHQTETGAVLLHRFERIEHQTETGAVLLHRLERFEHLLSEREIADGEWRSQLADVLSRLERIEQYGAVVARRVVVNSGPDDLIIRTEVGYLLCSATDHALVAALLDGGDLELGTRLLIERFLRPGDTFVDVGANIGMHTLAAARAMRRRGRIVAFEPFGPTKRRLDKTLWLNGISTIAEVFEAAVSDRLGTNTLFLGAVSGHHSLTPLDTPTGSSEDSVEVETVTLDEKIDRHESVTLIKIDVEGAEPNVVRGARSVINKNFDVALIIEFGPSHLKRTGITTADWFSGLTQMGLTFRAINPQTGRLEDLPMDLLEATESTNLFFARPESSAWQKALAKTE